LEDYRKQTGTKPVDHARIIKCNSVESITAIIQEQAHGLSNPGATMARS
jgi:hypothetical protein